MKTGEDRDELKNISVDNELEEDSDLINEENIDTVSYTHLTLPTSHNV